MAVWASLAPAGAADLRISFAELTKLIEGMAAQSKIYLNTVPGLFTTGSYVSVAGQQKPLPIQAQTFNILTSTYTYYINDVTSGSVSITPISSGLRLTVTFPKDGAVLTGACLSGNCTFKDALPDIVWPGAMALIDFVPVQANGSVSLKVTNVQLLGAPRAVCRSSAGVISESACAISRPWANRTIQTTKAQIAQTIKDEINKPEIQQQLADGLKQYLSLGPAGAIAINNLTIEPKSMTIKFMFATGG